MGMKKDNRGTALSMVIIIIAFVSVLVAAVLSVSMMNVYMKSVDRKAKENFYSAEGALEQINLGLQKEMSKAAADAYRTVMLSYAEETSEAARRLRFNQAYVSGLKTAVGVSGVEGSYDRAVLESFLSDDIKTYAKVNAKGEPCSMDAAGEARGELVLEKVVVSFTDPEGYVTYLETDIRMSAPNLNLVHPLEMPDVFEYSIIANQKLTAANNSVTAFGANVYAGADGMVLGEGSRLTFDGTEKLVVVGDITIPRTGLLAVDGEMDLWTNEIRVNGGTLRTNGRTYVANDLILSAQGSEADLNGEYYGYGNGLELKENLGDDTNPDYLMLGVKDESSAILINGTQTTLDMSGTRKLLLAGSAQVRGDIVGEEEGRNSNTIVNLGESVEVKSNQIAYLVPAECIGVSKGKALIGRNPMTEQEYTKLRQYKTDLGDDFEEVSFTTEVKGLGKTLAEYKSDKPEKAKGYREIYLTDVHGNKLVYFYLDFDVDGAARYFQDYYKANKDTLDRFMDNYVDEITSGSRYFRLMTDGNMVVRSQSGTMELLDSSNNGIGISEEQRNLLLEECSGYRRRFKALGTKLVFDYEDLTKEEKKKTVFDNIIRYSTVPGSLENSVFAGIPASGKTYEADGDSHTKAVVVNNKNGVAYAYKDDSANEVCLIIATGDVVLEQNFKGVVIAGGIVTIADNVKAVTGNTEKLRKILKTRMAEDPTKTLIEYFFRDGDKYALDEGLGEETVLKSDYIDFGELISYEDWTKR